MNANSVLCHPPTRIMLYEHQLLCLSVHSTFVQTNLFFFSSTRKTFSEVGNGNPSLNVLLKKLDFKSRKLNRTKNKSGDNYPIFSPICHLGAFGCARLCLAVFGCAWLCLAVYGCARLCEQDKKIIIAHIVFFPGYVGLD